jgi:hypothetical protein
VGGNSAFAVTKKADEHCGGQSQDPSEPVVGHSNVCNFSADRIRAVVLFLQCTDVLRAFFWGGGDEEVIKDLKLYRVHSIQQNPLIAALFFCTQSRCNYKL